MPASLNELVALLDLEPLEVGLFRGGQPPTSNLERVYGGQVAGQAVVAAQATVEPDRHLHSLHLYFILGGDPSLPIIYDVEKVRDGRSFTTRRVAARQHGEIIFFMTASFQKDESGWEHQDPMPEVPDPQSCMPLDELIGHFDADTAERWAREWASMDIRYVGDNRSEDDPTRAMVPTVQRFWFRANGTLEGDRATHNAVLTYMSDLTLLGASLVPHQVYIGSPEVSSASLDHVIWFHDEFRADEWLLYDQQTPFAGGGRGLSIGRLFTQDGRLVATLAQEGLIRRTQR